MSDKHTHPILTLVAVAALAFALPFALAAPFNDDGQPNAANKTAASGTDFQYLGTAALPLPPTAVLDTWIKTSGPADAIISVSMECSILTDVFSTTIANHTMGYTSVGRAEASIDVWVVIDGVRTLTVGDDDRITFCDRVHQQEIDDIDEDTGNFTIRQFQETMNANAFNWVALDLGAGLHHVEVFATIDADNTEGSFAQGGIGSRTLVVEPVKFPTGATF